MQWQIKKEFESMKKIIIQKYYRNYKRETESNFFNF